MNKVLYVSCHKDNNTNDPMGTLEQAAAVSNEKLAAPIRLRKNKDSDIWRLDLNCLILTQLVQTGFFMLFQV